MGADTQSGRWEANRRPTHGETGLNVSSGRSASYDSWRCQGEGPALIIAKQRHRGRGARELGGQRSETPHGLIPVVRHAGAPSAGSKHGSVHQAGRGRMGRRGSEGRRLSNVASPINFDLHAAARHPTSSIGQARRDGISCKCRYCLLDVSAVPGHRGAPRRLCRPTFLTANGFAVSPRHIDNTRRFSCRTGR
jgi:hypothetical protein